MFSVVRIFLIYILYFNLAIKSIYAEKFIDVTTENQFKDALSKKTSDEIKINIKNNIIVNDIEKLNINSSISKITIKGESLSKSKLTFTHQNGGLYFDKNIQEINILDITLISSMLFNNNENIKFENVIIDDGSYIFNMTSTKENNVTITNSRINPPEIKKSFLMEFYQSNLYIDHTQFYGNKNLLKGVILMRNEKEFLASGKFHLTNTLFSGGYETKFLDVNSVKEIRFSNSEMKESFGKNELGGCININKCNDIIINDVLFHDNYSQTNGASLYLYKALVSSLENLTFINSTAYSTGGGIFFHSERIDHGVSSLRNVTFKDIYSTTSSISRGHAISTYGYITINIDNLYCENINSYTSDGPLIFLNEDIDINIYNAYIKKIYGNGVGALFINTVNTNNVRIMVENLNFSDSYIKSYQNTAVLLWINGGRFVGTNLNIKNIGGDYTSFISLQNNAIGIFKNMIVDGFNSKITYPFFLNDGHDNSQNTLEIYNSTVKNINSNGALILLQETRCFIKDSTFENIHLCYKNKECAVNKDSISELDRSSIAQLYSRSTLIMEDVLFNNVYGETCFYNSRYSTTNIKNSNFSNIYEESGIFKFSSKDYFYGTFNIRNSTFNNNRSLKGGVIHVEDVENANYLIVFYDSFFYNNAAELYGGVIFSIHSSVKERVIFENCEFYNNTAEFGNLAYSLNIDSEPIFVYNDTSKLSQLKSIKNTFVTNPSKLVINEDSNKINDILSGDIIHDDIIVNIYDDYGSKFSFGSNVDKLNIDELVFFKVEIEDTEGKKDNVVLFGQTQEYCWEDACSINNIKIVGNPGNYVFKLKLLTYGSYSEFDDNEVSLDVTIKECDESKYIYQTKDHSVLKSCYTPHCDPSCNSGNCINDNVCDCSNTPYTGLHCNEYYKLERNIFMYDLYQIIAIVLFVITMICLALLLVYKNASIIKGGGFEFLIIILVGITYNCGYIIFLSKERLNVKRCVLMYAMRNMGFALVFGSILVKTLRIYIIFKHVRHSTSFKLYKMYLIIASIFLFHVMLLFLWICFDKISCNAQYTKDEKEFYDCQFPNTKIFSFVFNTSILIVGVILAYSIRYVNDNFKEQLAVPVYIYTVLSLFSEIVDHIDDLTLFFKDSVGVLVTSLSSLVVLYFLYIQKFYAVAHQNKRERSRNIGSVFVKQYPRRSGLS